MELGKLPSETDGTARYDWARFINAETEEELNMVAQRNPQIKQAAVKLRELSADEKARDMLERREKGRRDYQARMTGAWEKGWETGWEKGVGEGRVTGLAEAARNAKGIGMDVATIVKLTGLTREEVEGL